MFMYLIVAICIIFVIWRFYQGICSQKDKGATVAQILNELDSIYEKSHKSHKYEKRVQSKAGDDLTAKFGNKGAIVITAIACVGIIMYLLFK